MSYIYQLSDVARRIKRRAVSSILPRPEFPRRVFALPIGPHDTHVLTHSRDGHRIFLDATDLHITLHVLEHGCWEDHIRDVLKRVLGPGATFIDVNVGLHTLFAASIVGQTGRVIAFEPIPRFLKTLRQNVDVNGLSTVVRCHGMAIADEIGERDFSCFTSHPAMSGYEVAMDRLDYFDETVSSIERIKVSTTTLDAALTDVDRVDAIKIDIEGFEPVALRGAADTLRKHPDVTLIIEWCPLLMQQMSGEGAAERLIAMLEENGFRPYLALWQQPLRGLSWETVLQQAGDLICSRRPLI
jgi:FkbM family methyltransferase